MAERMGFAHWLFSDAGQAALAGAAGGVVRWVTLRDNWREGLTGLAVGSICAIYLGPLVVPLLEPTIGRIAPGDVTAQFTGFILGLGGISISGFILDLIKARRAQLDRTGGAPDEE